MASNAGPASPRRPLPDRHRRILAALVGEYIERGEPVSSLWLVKDGRFGLSSATVRSVMADLERVGYVSQPHTSAGRVPTDLGYRCYVDLILQERRPARSAREVEARLRRAGTVEGMLANASHELSRVSHHVGFALAPASDAATLSQIDFVSLGAAKVLVVLIAAGGHISHKVVDLGERVPPHELQQAANYLNAEFAGMTLADVRSAVVERLQQERTLYDALLSRALRLASSTLEEIAPQSDLFVDGASSLLEDAFDTERETTLEMLRSLFKMIEEKRRLIRLLGEYVDGPGLTVVIGTEHSAPDLRNFSLVASTYWDGKRIGTVGVIGPRRMRYSRAIAAVDSVSRAVSRVLVIEQDG